MAITAADVSKLRKMTGAGMMIKNASKNPMMILKSS
jgi:translation elongation factor EF-Ts